MVIRDSKTHEENFCLLFQPFFSFICPFWRSNYGRLIKLHFSFTPPTKVERNVNVYTFRCFSTKYIIIFVQIRFNMVNILSLTSVWLSFARKERLKNNFCIWINIENHQKINNSCLWHSLAVNVFSFLLK